MRSLPFDFRSSEKTNSEHFEGAPNNEQFSDPANGSWRDVNHSPSLHSPSQRSTEMKQNKEYLCGQALGEKG